MIVTEEHLKEENASQKFGSAADPCFFCGKPLGTPFIVWSGMLSGPGSRLCLHHDCCWDLTLRLARDVHELKQTRGVRVAFVSTK